MIGKKDERSIMRSCWKLCFVLTAAMMMASCAVKVPEKEGRPVVKEREEAVVKEEVV